MEIANQTSKVDLFDDLLRLVQPTRLKQHRYHSKMTVSLAIERDRATVVQSSHFRRLQAKHKYFPWT